MTKLPGRRGEPSWFFHARYTSAGDPRGRRRRLPPPAAGSAVPSSAWERRASRSCISQTREHVGWRWQLAFRVTIALLFCAYSHCGPFLYEYIQAPTDLAEQMLSGNSTTSYSNLVFKLFAIPICNR